MPAGSSRRNVGYLASYLARRDGSTVPILPEGAQDVWVWDVSKDGTVAGNTGGANARCFVWHDSQAGGQLVDLGVPEGGAESGALGLNDRDVVVGRWFDSVGEHPFLARGTQMVDLTPLIDDAQGLSLWGAIGINNAGVIIGNAARGGVRHGYMLTPID